MIEELRRKFIFRTYIRKKALNKGNGKLLLGLLCFTQLISNTEM